MRHLTIISVPFGLDLGVFREEVLVSRLLPDAGVGWCFRTVCGAQYFYHHIP